MLLYEQIPQKAQTGSNTGSYLSIIYKIYCYVIFVHNGPVNFYWPNPLTNYLVQKVKRLPTFHFCVRKKLLSNPDFIIFKLKRDNRWKCFFRKCHLCMYNKFYATKNKLCVTQVLMCPVHKLSNFFGRLCSYGINPLLAISTHTCAFHQSLNYWPTLLLNTPTTATIVPSSHLHGALTPTIT